MYISEDYGTTFNDISDKFKIPAVDGSEGNSQLAIIAKFYHHPDNGVCHYVFTDIINKAIFTTTNCGQDFEVRT